MKRKVQDFDDDEEIFIRRKFSNEAIRQYKVDIDNQGLKSPLEGYNDVLDRVTLPDKKMRTKDEIKEDKKANKDKKIK
jgi:hypothetical protein